MRHTKRLALARMRMRDGGQTLQEKLHRNLNMLKAFPLKMLFIQHHSTSHGALPRVEGKWVIYFQGAGSTSNYFQGAREQDINFEELGNTVRM